MMINKEIPGHTTLSDSARIDFDSLARVRQYIFLGRLPDAIHLIEEITPSTSMPHQAVVLLVRVLLLQGQFTQVDSICQTALKEAVDDDSTLWEVRLWQGFLQIYTQGDAAPAISSARAILEKAQKSPDALQLAAQAQVILGKALAITVDWGLQPMAHMIEAYKLLDQANKFYQAIDATDEALSTTLSLGQIYLIEAASDSVKARAIFQDVQTRALKARNPVRLADATLRLAEIDFGAVLRDEAITPKHLEHFPTYQQTLDLYKQAGYVLGSADVFLSLGNCLMTNGFDGVALLVQALEDYRKEDNLVGMQRAVSSLCVWYTRQGDLPQALKYHQSHMEISQQMGMAAGQAIAFIGLGDYYYRTANYAQALAYYEQAEKLTSLRIVGAMVGLVIANAYTFMRLPDRAERVCYAIIAALEPGGPSARLSLARYILGHVLSSKNAWAEAIVVWRVGLAEDEARGDRMSQAQMLQSIAQATVIQYYNPKGPPIPEAAYQEAMSLYAKSISLLEGDETPQARAIVAHTYQLQGQTTIACGQHLTGINPLKQAASIYASLDMTMQAATTSTILGLLYYGLGNRGQPDFYKEAALSYGKAIDYFRDMQMLDMTWKVLFYLALALFHLGRFALTGDEQKTWWLRAASLLEEANANIELVRGRFIEVDAVSTQFAHMGIIADKETMYINAIQLHYYHLKDSQSAFMWVERLKGRTFLDALALTTLHAPVELDQKLLDHENKLLLALHHALDQTTVVSLNEELHALWNQIISTDDTSSAVIEYVSMRRGVPMSWQDIRVLLQS